MPLPRSLISTIRRARTTHWVRSSNSTTQACSWRTDSFRERTAEDERAARETLVSRVRATVATFFREIDESNVADRLNEVHFEHHDDLLCLVARHGVLQRVPAEPMLTVLDQVDVQLGEMLPSKTLVSIYEKNIRGRLISSPRHAEHLTRKFLEADQRRESFISEESHS